MTEQEDPILAKARQLRQAGASIQEVQQYLTSKGYETGEPERPARPVMAADASAFRAPGASTEGDYPVLGRGIAANLLSATQVLPGMEAFQAAAGSFGSKFTDNPMSFGESRDALRSETDAIPAAIKYPIRFAAGAPVAAMLPTGPTKTVLQAAKSGAKLGAGLGAADAALSADDLSLGDRALGTAAGGVVGGTLGGLFGGGARAIDKGRQHMTLRGRVKDARTLGQVNEAQKTAISAADAKNYGNAEVEGKISAHLPTPADVTTAFSESDIAKYVKEIRDSRTFRGADDATVLREALKLMSEHQGKLNAQAVSATDYKAGTSLAKSDVGLAKKQLRDAGAQMMPSLPIADAEHADLMGQRGTFRDYVGHGRRMAGGGEIDPKKFDKQSPEAVKRLIGQLPPEELQAGLDALLGVGKKAAELPRWQPNQTGWAALTGLSRPVTKLNRLAPFIEQFDARLGNPTQQPLDVQQLLRMLGLANTFVSNP